MGNILELSTGYYAVEDDTLLCCMDEADIKADNWSEVEDLTGLTVGQRNYLKIKLKQSCKFNLIISKYV